MNRRGFLASLVALAVAPAVKAMPQRRISRNCHFPPYRSFECGYVELPTEMKLTRAQAEATFKAVCERNSRSVQAMSFGKGGMVPSLTRRRF